MSGVLLQYYGPPIFGGSLLTGGYNSLTDAGPGFSPKMKGKIVGTYKRGTRVRLDCVLAQSWIDATTAPQSVPLVPNTLVWEGPYVRVYPAFTGPGSNTHIRTWDKGQVFARDPGIGGGSLAVGQSSVTSPVVDGSAAIDVETTYYEFDAINGCNIHLPFDARIDVVTGLAGMWAFNVYESFPVTEADFSPSSSQYYYQTRWFGANADGTSIRRYLRVPYGAEELRHFGYINNGYASLTIITNDDDYNPKGAGGGTNVIYYIPGGSADAYSQWAPCSGWRTLDWQKAGVSGRGTAIQFKIRMG